MTDLMTLLLLMALGYVIAGGAAWWVAHNLD